MVAGDHLGRKLGFPTANLDTAGLVLPPHGVYVVEAAIPATLLGLQPATGLIFRVNQRVDINLGYRFLVVSKTTYQYQGQGYGFGRRGLNVFSLSAVMRF